MHWRHYNYRLDPVTKEISRGEVDWKDPDSVAYWHQDQVGKRVEETTVGSYWISTVFLGFDHGFGDELDPDYRPLLFETMVFRKDPQREGLGEDQEMERYHSWEEAKEGHSRWVHLYQRKLTWWGRLQLWVEGLWRGFLEGKK
jgi:hypothetical protein